MKCTLSDLRCKEIINIKDGTKLGYVDDIEIDTNDASVKSLIVYGRCHLFGLLGKDEDIIIKCRDIEIVGTDTILISVDSPEMSKKCTVQVKSLCK